MSKHRYVETPLYQNSVMSKQVGEHDAFADVRELTSTYRKTYTKKDPNKDLFDTSETRKVLQWQHLSYS